MSEVWCTRKYLGFSGGPETKNNQSFFYFTHPVFYLEGDSGLIVIQNNRVTALKQSKC